MIIFLMMTSMMVNFIFISMSNPLSLGFILLIQTILISLICSFLTYSFWMSYILFLIMVGGMLILFTYMTSIASNEIFSLSNKISMLIILFTAIFTFLLLIDKTTFIQTVKTAEMNNFMNIIMMINENTIILNKIYNKPSYIITIILINYLLLALIIVVKITNISSGPLRQKF